MTHENVRGPHQDDLSAMDAAGYLVKDVLPRAIVAGRRVSERVFVITRTLEIIVGRPGLINGIAGLLLSERGVEVLYEAVKPHADRVYRDLKGDFQDYVDKKRRETSETSGR